jgi:trehalose 6-phosphate phosphatase
MPQPLFDHLSEVASSVREARRLLVFLDFDGTLAPIDEIPDEARMPPETRLLLRRIAEDSRFSVVIISGRALSDIEERVGLEHLIYAGNHGLEISGRGLDYVQPAAALRIKALGELSRRLRGRLRHIPGIEIENKVLTTSVHYRRAAEGSEEEVAKIIDAVAGGGQSFQVTEGLKVFEIRPRVSWNKGLAVRWIKATTREWDALSVYLGDDLTDEDAFAALPDGLTVRVGRDRETAARYFVEEQAQVAEFLDWLARNGNGDH